MLASELSLAPFVEPGACIRLGLTERATTLLRAQIPSWAANVGWMGDGAGLAASVRRTRRQV